ncbi:isopeptide-forming domain-containing fimbrial protein [Companilactobacillus baiquanensis]|uniref:Isopeptide-forming domain-containing fimbrial protein n=1 Tax=Companilactobacillus baiquanensis TaxID=2486005 RepID=A0ABW1UYY1_9LACO|nr:isopeptide-forming domain-containing fimbrial protein [Companilactobacillus baiquanensis]
MKRGYQKSLFLSLFFAVFMFLSVFSGAENVQAATITGKEIDDGITDWTSQGNSVVGSKTINSKLSLGYTFGLANDSSGNVTNGNDTSVVNPSTANGYNNISYSKMNVFLNDTGNYVGSVFQSGSTNSTNIKPENVSLTSPDFGIVFSKSDKGTNGINSKDYSVLMNMTGKKYFTGTDANGNKASKIVGNYSKTDSYGTHNFVIEILLRVSPGNAALVQREMYVKNTSTSAQSFGVFFGEDTKLGKFDTVRVKDLGNKHGVYIEDGSYKLMVSNSVPDGFTKYTGQDYTSASSMNWLGKFSDKTIAGTGDESSNNNYGQNLSTGSDSAYTLAWPYVTDLQVGETAHFGSGMGVTESPYSVPTPKKSFTNETSTDGKNRVGDKLKFTLGIGNFGYQSQWNLSNIKDKIPAGLQIDPSSIKKIDANGTTTSIDSSAYDATTKTLNAPVNTALTDGQEAAITFEATITSDADGATINNTGDFLGTDPNEDNGVIKTYSASVNIPVEGNPYKDSFTQEIKNSKDTNWGTSAKGTKGDTVDFKNTYTVLSNSTDSFQGRTATFKPDIPAGLTASGDATFTFSDGSQSYTSSANAGTIIMYELKPGDSVTVTYSATITGDAGSTLYNDATLSNGKTSSGTSLGTLTTNQTTVNIENLIGFTSIPTKIDFGTVHMAGKEKTLSNISTEGQLIVNNSSEKPYDVTVSYDNNDQNTQLKDPLTGTVLAPSTDSGLLFLKQRTSSDTDSGTWQSVDTTGTKIRNDAFTGNQDLTNYIGVGDWRLKLAPTTNPGGYSGKITWNISDSI